MFRLAVSLLLVAPACGFGDRLIRSGSAAEFATESDAAEYYNVVCGGTVCFEGQVDVAEVDEEHEVRCCSDTSLEGWTKKDRCDVWSQSDVDGCHEASFAQAARLCADAGARLCTMEELADKCTEGSGCGFDDELIWSSTSDRLIYSSFFRQADPQAICEDTGFVLAESMGQLQLDKPQAQAIFMPNVFICVGPVTSKRKVDIRSNMANTMDDGWWPDNDSCYALACVAKADNAEAPTSVPTARADVEFYNLVCGKGTTCIEGNVAVASAYEDHEVRCCSDTFLEGWTKRGQCAVWSQSDVDGCHEASFALAERLCADAGARLCTMEELTDECTRGSGCGFDNQLIWSSTSTPLVYSGVPDGACSEDHPCRITQRPQVYCEDKGLVLADSVDQLAGLEVNFSPNYFVCLGPVTSKRYVDIRSNAVYDGWWPSEYHCDAFACVASADGAENLISDVARASIL